MNDLPGYAVFFFPNALEALGDAIKPYLQDGPAGQHIPCSEVDTGGAFVELTLQGQTQEGRDASLELMVPSSMVRMIVSARTDASFGFTPRLPVSALPQVAPQQEVTQALPAPQAETSAEDASPPPPAPEPPSNSPA